MVMKKRLALTAAIAALLIGVGTIQTASTQVVQQPGQKPAPQKPVTKPAPQPQPKQQVTPNLAIEPKLPIPSVALMVQPLPGWADLHAHPASHLAFGANASGEKGIFWGKPGMALASSDPSVDMPSCSPDKHGGYDDDVVRHLTQQTVIGTIDNITGYTHGANGAPSFANWPNSRSLTHQQMHITMLKRAYDGGQRMMIASVTDNEFLSALWSKIGYNAAGNQVPRHDPNFNLQSARRQLTFIKNFVRANPTWMEIALTPADARRIITDNKMAIILSLEMDTLSPRQVLDLVQNDGVRHVIPIHLINNEMGGAAVYTDAFNTANAFVNSTRQSGNWNNLGGDGYFKVQYDPKLSGRLGRPQTLIAEGANLVQGGAIWPRQVDDATWAGLDYDRPLSAGGHRNALGLTPAGKTLLRDLAQRGVIIDIAHMGESSADTALRFASTNDYPVMNSHTGMRKHDETASNERALPWRHLATIKQVGGVIGLGTEGTSGQQPILIQPEMPQNTELVRFTGAFTMRPWSVDSLPGNPIVSNLTVTIKTGGDDLRGGNNWVKARVTLGAPGAATRDLEFDLSKGANWANGSTKSATFALPAGTRADDIRRFALVTNPNGKNGDFDSPDNWNVDTLRVDATLSGVDTIGSWLGEYKEVLEAMGGRGVAIGTDMNGFAPQVPFSSQPVTYPLTVASQVKTWKSGYTPPALTAPRLGPRAMNFQRDGAAHYGMLADFMQAVSQKPGSAAAVTGLYRSANDVVVMWEKADARKGQPFTIPPG